MKGDFNRGVLTALAIYAIKNPVIFLHLFLLCVP